MWSHYPLRAQPYPSPPRMHAQAYTLVGQGACRGAGGALDKVNSRSKEGLDKARVSLSAHIATPSRKADSCSSDGRPHARRRATPSLQTEAMASALATRPILTPSPSSNASCTARACPARARRPMTPSWSRMSATLWAPAPLARRLSLSVARAPTYRRPRRARARPWGAPGRRTCGRRPASGSFRPRRCVG